MLGEKYISVSQLNAYANVLINSDSVLQNLFVTGEISNLKYHPSGNVYFTLKDDFSAIRCIAFKNQAELIDWNIENGTQVLASGRAALYERDGQFQFYVQALGVQGRGAQYAAFEELKRKLETEGLFELERKKPLPLLPRRIGIVTSESGAVIRDIIHVSRRRCPNIDLLLYPVKVQGLDAGADIAQGIRTLNEAGMVDVIIIGRGGGSMEDLWAFNEEGVARAIAASRVPVVSAVGHQTDFTIADFVADCRAPTPSAAAEICVPVKSQLEETIRQLAGRSEHILQNTLDSRKHVLSGLQRSGAFFRIERKLDTFSLALDTLDSRIRSLVRDRFSKQEQKWDMIREKLSALNPKEILGRGYALVTDPVSCRVIRSAASLEEGRVLRILFSDGTADVVVNSKKIQEQEGTLHE